MFPLSMEIWSQNVDPNLNSISVYNLKTFSDLFLANEVIT